MACLVSREVGPATKRLNVLHRYLTNGRTLGTQHTSQIAVLN